MNVGHTYFLNHPPDMKGNDMDISEIFSVLGLKLSAVVAGFAGGLVSLLAEKRKSFRRAVVMLIVGSLTAGYITPLITLHAHFDTDKFDPDNSLGFLIGLISMRVIDLILSGMVYVKKNPRTVIDFFVRYFKKTK